MRTHCVTAFLFLFSFAPAFTATAQLITEDFAYNNGQLTSLNGGANVSDSAWMSFSGTGNPLLVGDGSLSVPGYAHSGVGGKLKIVATSASAEDAFRTFPAQPAGTTVYVSFLVAVLDTLGLTPNSNVTGDHFVSLLPSTSSSTFVARVSIRRGTVSGTYQLGLRASASNAATEWFVPNLASGGTHLVVLRYRSVQGAQNDTASLWVDPAFDGPEPSADLAQVTASTSDVADVGRIAIRQGSGTPNAELDGIIVSNFWGSTPPLPLQLVSFSAFQLGDNKVQLNWETLSETGNYGFLVQKSATQQDTYQTVSGIIPGHGTTNVPQSYAFVDSIQPIGRFYRLEQIDLDQEVHFSEPVQVSGVASVGTFRPMTFTLDQNYPDPFNPTTAVSYQLSAASEVKLAVYDILGREVAVLVNERKAPGRYEATFDASRLASGVYIYRLTAGQNGASRKMILLK
jgi:hypothetical protein